VSTPRFSKRNIPLANFRFYRKKVLTSACRIKGPFIVETREGTLRCEDGWLALDSNGDPYPIAVDVFEELYEVA
jgi:hypothetical protein